jgi:hypothetical protein
MKRCGLRHMTATVLRRELTRAQENKNWEVNRLTPGMKVSYELGHGAGVSSQAIGVVVWLPLLLYIL